MIFLSHWVRIWTAQAPDLDSQVVWAARHMMPAEVMRRFWWRYSNLVGISVLWIIPTLAVGSHLWIFYGYTDILATSHSKPAGSYLCHVLDDSLMFASFNASPFNDTHGDLGLFPSQWSQQQWGIYRFDRSWVWWSMCDFFCRHLFQWCWRCFFLGGWCWRIADFLTQNLAFFHFFSSFETGSWEVNHSFESDLCCGDSWLRRSLRWNEVWTRWGEKVRMLIEERQKSQGWCSFSFDRWLAMKEMFFLLTCTPAKLHSNGSHRLQQEIHLLSDSFWKNSLPSWFTWNVTTKSQLLFIFHLFQFRTFFRHLRSQLPHCQLGSPFWMGGGKQHFGWQTVNEKRSFHVT